MNKKLIFGICILFLLVFVMGCNTTNTAYFTLGNYCDNYNKTIWAEKCNSLCDNSGIRIRNYKNGNSVSMENGEYICTCY